MRGDSKVKGQRPHTKTNGELTSKKFQAKVEGEGVDRAVSWKDRRMWPYECDACKEWVDEPDEDNLFDCYVVIVGTREMGCACSEECLQQLKDSELVIQAVSDGRIKGI